MNEFQVPTDLGRIPGKIYCVLWEYLEEPFETDSLNSIIIPLKINKYCRCQIGSEIFGSTFSPRHQKSSYILAKFASEDDSIDIYPGQIQFFFVHEIKQMCNVELWDTEFYSKSRDCIIPVHHILERFVPVKYKISNRKNAKEYLACADTLLKKYSDGITKATFGYSLNLNKVAVLFDENSIINRDAYSFTEEWPTQWINDGITKATFGYSLNLNKVAVLFDENSIINRDAYSFTEEWPTQWIKSVYNTFLLCFQLPINPLHDGDLSEYAYRDRIVNRIIEDVFLDVNNVICIKTGEIENIDRKAQKDSARPSGQ
ncbi:hypothetical protein Glove_4g15 [Diversispora epigaea]|uniref:Uncharacterized protein n=1 Tax=Diversispora epigaea TaxID=1348612 RepID=A0A397JPD0_9GLOM|nr:hypothetical protein Glove_4g15 [Diversispora epigaea]